VKKVEVLKEMIGVYLPELSKMVKEKADVVVLHQDAFAADYQMDEYILLGMAIKYIGLSGKEILIIGKNQETLKEK